ncbi:serine hydrolase domain-containing protein [Vibrio cionasavignyae]|uniref:serine hydrolase domain-containing protein n=1 Tax=Vibrio cionasavignyae TaxID=2910252 RepID=UPI003D096B5A
MNILSPVSKSLSNKSREVIMTLIKRKLALVLGTALVTGSLQAASISIENTAPLSNQSIINIDNWQQQRAAGLDKLEKIMPNVMSVNAQDVYPLEYQATHYDLYEVPSVKRLIDHPAVASIVVTKGNEVILEHYKNGYDRASVFSAQSSTKTITYMLLNKALKKGALSMDDKVERYLPDVGPGFRGRTIGNLAAMAVNHNVAELAAYLGDKQAEEMFDRDEQVIGLRRNDDRETTAQFVKEIDIAPGSTSNEWTKGHANYASINTATLGLIVEKATGVPLQTQVRNLMHRIGGQHTVHMGTDYAGYPSVSASMLASTVDFARYGRLLIEDKKQYENDLEAAKQNGEFVPAEWHYVDSHYYKSAIFNDYGIGHGGWAGQLIWADPQSDTVVAIYSQMNAKLPNPSSHHYKLNNAVIDVVKQLRADQEHGQK